MLEFTENLIMAGFQLELHIVFAYGTIISSIILLLYYYIIFSLNQRDLITVLDSMFRL